MIFFLHGADSWRARQKLKEIVEKYQASYRAQGEVRLVDCADVSVEEAKSIVDADSLFVKKRMIVFRDVFQESVFEEFFLERVEALAQDESRIIVILETQEIKEKTSRSLYRLLTARARHQEFTLLSPSQLKRWMEREFQRYGLRISSRAQDALARNAGKDTWRLAQEIRKIAAWKQSKREKWVKEAEITLLAAGTHGEADVFTTIDAVAQKNKKQALALLYRHQAKGDSPLYLLSMLCYEMRILLQIRDAQTRGIAPQELAHKTKLHPYVLAKGLQVARRFSLDETKALYGALFGLDIGLKVGRVEPAGAFDLFIAKLSGAGASQSETFFLLPLSF